MRWQACVEQDGQQTRSYKRSVQGLTGGKQRCDNGRIVLSFARWDLENQGYPSYEIQGCDHSCFCLPLFRGRVKGEKSADRRGVDRG